MLKQRPEDNRGMHGQMTIILYEIERKISIFYHHFVLLIHKITKIAAFLIVFF